MSTDNELPMVVARAPRLLETVQSSAAAVSRDVVVVTDAEQVRQRWRSAPVVLIGAECAAMVTGLGLASRTGVHVMASDAADAVAWSVPLQASVVVLPEGAGVVTGVLAEVGQGAGSAEVVAVWGCSGGLGVSTLVAGLAQVAATQSRRVAAVELAANSGGLDLLMAAERQPGWRWPDLMSASGHLGDLSGQLPRSADVDLVSVGRTPAAPSAGAVTAVTQSLTRSHELVVVDAGRWGGGSVPLALVRRHLVVVGADVRSVVAATSLLGDRVEDGAALVVRSGRDRRLTPAEVERAVGLPLAGVITDDRSVPQALDAGDLPARRRGSSFTKQCRVLLTELAGREAAA